MKRLGHFGLVALVAVFGTAAYLVVPRWLNPPLEEGPAAARVARLAERQDTTALARLAQRQCASTFARERQTCYEAYFVDLAERGGVRVALGALAALAADDRSVESEGHVYTHVIGIRSWKPGESMSDAFRACTGLFQSGCYHGVIQSYLTAEAGVDSAKVAWLCDLVEGTNTDRWLRFQCVHGLGHGLEMIWNWDLPRALQGCDWLVSDWDRESCYGGAFMENAVAAQPHHAPAELLAQGAAAASADGRGDHGGHGGHTLDPGAAEFKKRDSSDVLYPCTIMEDRYLVSCYMLQGGVALRMLDLDYDAATRACDRVPEHVRQYCYLSIGTSASGLTVQDARKTARLCEHGDPGYRPWCIIGAVKNFIDVTADPQDGLDFCPHVPLGPSRRQCYVAVGEQLSILYGADNVARERWCAKAPQGDAEDCRYGAGLLRVAPPGLPIRPGAGGGA
jgi:hypothetical protein